MLKPALARQGIVLQLPPAQRQQLLGRRQACWLLQQLLEPADGDGPQVVHVDRVPPPGLVRQPPGAGT